MVVRRLSCLFLLTIGMIFSVAAHAQQRSGQILADQGYAGSQSCRQCHERFYELWSTSRHGLAMQPYTTAFGAKNLTAQRTAITIEKASYRADITSGLVIEKGPKGDKRYRIDHALGGKNVYYFLTPLPRGRLQTLPVAYDVKTKTWFDTAGSGVRHFPGAERDRPISWRDSAYTFNTGCYNCHVSQLTSNYTLTTDTYRTTWREPGINCETCHGPSAEHNRVCLNASKGTVPKDLKIISVKSFTPDQHNAACSGCHAKMSPLTATVTPGERFFDHYDLVTLEDPDYYPDGRDLGENYTYTSWLMSPCTKTGKLSCVTCHTSSGRYRFAAEEKANDACMPCHEKHVTNAPAHSHHRAGSPATRCIACHMPTTSFARMKRTDHSMLPPAPAATIAFTSPNACNICHTDKDALWSDQWVRRWRNRDYQAPVLRRAALIDAARKRDWRKLPAIMDYITGKERNEVFAASLIRLISPSGDSRIGPALLKAMEDPSPLVRASAADGLQFVPSAEGARKLVEATGDAYRLVRVRAASSLAAYPQLVLNDTEKKRVGEATGEYRLSITARPDLWSSHYNLGNYHLNRGDLKPAVSAFDTALKLEPQAVLPMVNRALAYARLGETRKADESLQLALKTAPGNPVAHFNMGLLRAEQNNLPSAEKHLKAAIKADPQMAQAAYNLCIITARDRITEAVTYCRKAVELKSDEAKYAYSLALFLDRSGDRPGAVQTLDAIIAKHPSYGNAYALLGEIYEKQGEERAAEQVYRKALGTEGIDSRQKKLFAARLGQLNKEGQDRQK